MKIFKILVGFCLFCASLTAANLNDIKARGFVKIGVFSDKPPFGYIDKNAKYQGYDIFLAKRLVKNLFGDENKVEFTSVEAASRVEFLRADKVDIILANFTKTEERSKVVDFALPYMQVSLGVVSKNGEITDISQLKDKILLVNKGTTADIYFTKNHREIKKMKFDQNTETFAALIDGRGDALAHDNTLLFAWVKNNPSFKVAIASLGEPDVIAPAVKKGNVELLKWINDQISALNAENFFLKAYNATIKPVYGDEIDPNSIIIKP